MKGAKERKDANAFNLLAQVYEIGWKDSLYQIKGLHGYWLVMSDEEYKCAH